MTTSTKEAGAFPTGIHWFCVHTRPRQETLAKAALEADGIATFYPRFKIKKRSRHWKISSLFPSYIFARFDAVAQLSWVRSARGVLYVVSFKNWPVAVSNEVIETIRSRCKNEVVDLTEVVNENYHTLQSGDRVEVEDGPLRGMRGIFQRKTSDDERVVILLKILGLSVEAELQREAVERL